MKSCSQCRQENRDDARFCHQCGGAFAVESQETVVEADSAPSPQTDAELWKAFIGPNADPVSYTQLTLPTRDLV